MAAFIAKQVVGKKLSSVKGALGDKEEKDDKKTDSDDEDAAAELEYKDGASDADSTAAAAELAEARHEAEERRKDKYRKMEEEREKMRQDIRDKYGLKKKLDDSSLEPADGEHRKTSADSTSNCADDQNLAFPTTFDELRTTVTQLPGKVSSNVGAAAEKCVLQ